MPRADLHRQRALSDDRYVMKNNPPELERNLQVRGAGAALEDLLEANAASMETEKVADRSDGHGRARVPCQAPPRGAAAREAARRRIRRSVDRGTDGPRGWSADQRCRYGHDAARVLRRARRTITTERSVQRTMPTASKAGRAIRLIDGPLAT